MTRRVLATIFAEDGFTLAEVMVVTMVLGFILSAAYLAMGTVNTVSDQMIARTQAQDQGQIALERMVRELREAQPISDGNGGEEKLHICTATSISFYADSDHNNTIERITYTAANGQLTRSLSNSGLANPQVSSFGGDSTSTVLASIDPSTSSMFTYTDSAAPPNVVTSADAVTAVRIALVTVAKSGASTVTVSFPSDQVEVRSF